MLATPAACILGQPVPPPPPSSRQQPFAAESWGGGSSYGSSYDGSSYGSSYGEDDSFQNALAAPARLQAAAIASTNPALAALTAQQRNALGAGIVAADAVRQRELEVAAETAARGGATLRERQIEQQQYNVFQHTETSIGGIGPVPSFGSQNRGAWYGDEAAQRKLEQLTGQDPTGRYQIARTTVVLDHPTISDRHFPGLAEPSRVDQEDRARTLLPRNDQNYVLPFSQIKDTPYRTMPFDGQPIRPPDRFTPQTGLSKPPPLHNRVNAVASFALPNPAVLIPGSQPPPPSGNAGQTNFGKADQHHIVNLERTPGRTPTEMTTAPSMLPTAQSYVGEERHAKREDLTSSLLNNSTLAMGPAAFSVAGPGGDAAFSQRVTAVDAHELAKARRQKEDSERAYQRFGGASTLPTSGSAAVPNNLFNGAAPNLRPATLALEQAQQDAAGRTVPQAQVFGAGGASVFAASQALANPSGLLKKMQDEDAMQRPARAAPQSAGVSTFATVGAGANPVHNFQAGAVLDRAGSIAQREQDHLQQAGGARQSFYGQGTSSFTSGASTVNNFSPGDSLNPRREGVQEQQLQMAAGTVVLPGGGIAQSAGGVSPLQNFSSSVPLQRNPEGGALLNANSNAQVQPQVSAGNQNVANLFSFAEQASLSAKQTRAQQAVHQSQQQNQLKNVQPAVGVNAGSNPFSTFSSATATSARDYDDPRQMGAQRALAAQLPSTLLNSNPLAAGLNNFSAEQTPRQSLKDAAAQQPDRVGGGFNSAGVAVNTNDPKLINNFVNLDRVGTLSEREYQNAVQGRRAAAVQDVVGGGGGPGGSFLRLYQQLDPTKKDWLVELSGSQNRRVAGAPVTMAARGDAFQDAQVIRSSKQGEMQDQGRASFYVGAANTVGTGLEAGPAYEMQDPSVLRERSDFKEQANSSRGVPNGNRSNEYTPRLLPKNTRECDWDRTMNEGSGARLPLIDMPNKRPADSSQIGAFTNNRHAEKTDQINVALADRNIDPLLTSQRFRNPFATSIPFAAGAPAVVAVQQQYLAAAAAAAASQQ